MTNQFSAPARRDVRLSTSIRQTPPFLKTNGSCAPTIQAARATGRFARVEVARDRTPGAARVLADLRALPGADVWLAEQTPVDMESTLLALARGMRVAA